MKDRKYKYTLTEIFVHQIPKTPIEKWMDDAAPNKQENFDYLNQVHEKISATIQDLKKTMSQPVPNDKKEDW